jgi:TfoX/Sxy family transcriptional regulator of competence genes
VPGKWTKSPPSLISTFTGVASRFPALETRSMFGYPSVFLNGNMVGGLHQNDLLLRLHDEDRARLLALSGAKVFEPSPGRPMREYVCVPRAMHADADELHRWMTAAVHYVASLPVKSARKAPPPDRDDDVEAPKKTETQKSAAAPKKAAPPKKHRPQKGGKKADKHRGKSKKR